jgi:hypothetical protein
MEAVEFCEFVEPGDVGLFAWWDVCGWGRCRGRRVVRRRQR